MFICLFLLFQFLIKIHFFYKCGDFKDLTRTRTPVDNNYLDFSVDFDIFVVFVEEVCVFDWCEWMRVETSNDR